MKMSFGNLKTASISVMQVECERNGSNVHADLNKIIGGFIFFEKKFSISEDGATIFPQEYIEGSIKAVDRETVLQVTIRENGKKIIATWFVLTGPNYTCAFVDKSTPIPINQKENVI